MLVNENLLGALANTIFPLWGSFRALRRLFGTSLFIKPFSDEKALIAELALSTMKIDFPSFKEILARKRVEKEAVKAAVAAKAYEPPAKEHNVGKKPRKKASMKKKEQVKAIVLESSSEPQITKEKDMNVEEHLDEFSWDGLKAIERRERIRELEAVNKEHVEKLLDIERKFKKATLKARYELLEEYKQSLLVDIDVVEEIELYEESLAEAEASSSAHRMNFEPPTAAVPTTTDEINPVACKLSTTDGPKDEPLEPEKATKQ
ncbi:hypothetical protein TIFTF001_013944 [Ficus carica]|uniref:Uncharacterized protein n=1 Tax=Ficus carica TaxID=3494 RepID=A0AA88A1W1_FICCA|nr:hypothetical protein TIFTF001_013944 [Ficus carica]